MRYPISTAAPPPPSTSPPAWPLRTEAVEIRAAILAAHKGVGIFHARAVVDLQHGPGRRA